MNVVLGCPIAVFGSLFYDLVDDQACWSQQTFGDDSERGPIGASSILKRKLGSARQKPKRRLNSDA